MKVFLDEQLTGLSKYLKSLGWDVKTVNSENMIRAKDTELVKYSKENGYVFVTKDDDASKLARLHKVPFVYLSFPKLAQIAHQELLELEKKRKAKLLHK